VIADLSIWGDDSGGSSQAGSSGFTGMDGHVEWSQALQKKGEKINGPKETTPQKAKEI